MVNNMEPKKLRQWIVNRLRTDEYEASLCKTSWITSSGRPSGTILPSSHNNNPITPPPPTHPPQKKK